MNSENKHALSIVTLAEDILNKKEPYLESMLKMAGLGEEFSCEKIDEDFRVFIVISSDSDHLPLSKSRQYCSPAWLEKCDKEIDEIKKFYQKDVSSSCVNLIKRFEKQIEQNKALGENSEPLRDSESSS